MNNGYLASSIEAIILASPEPIPGRKIADVIDEATPGKVAQAVAELNERYAAATMSMRVREIAGGYQHYILPDYVGYVEELFARRRKLRLTRAALETVAIIAYRQPVTKSEIEHIRGVASDGVLHNLLEKNMIAIVGRADTVGKPLQYGTSDEFLKFFGLNKIADLPKMSEIEELVKASDQRDQTELILEEGADGQVKLNVADGTFNPNSRKEEYELDDEPDSAEENNAETAEGSREGAHHLTIKLSSENEQSEEVDHSDAEQEKQRERSPADSAVD